MRAAPARRAGARVLLVPPGAGTAGRAERARRNAQTRQRRIARRRRRGRHQAGRRRSQRRGHVVRPSRCVDVYLTEYRAPRCRPRGRRVRVARVGRCHGRRVEKGFPPPRSAFRGPQRVSGFSASTREIAKPVSSESPLPERLFMLTRLDSTSYNFGRLKALCIDAYDRYLRNLQPSTARVRSDGLQRTTRFDGSRASALVAPRATRGSARDSHRGRSLRSSLTVRARLGAAERERRNRLAIVGVASSRASRSSRISFPRQRPAGSCRSLDSARRASRATGSGRERIRVFAGH